MKQICCQEAEKLTPDEVRRNVEEQIRNWGIGTTGLSWEGARMRVGEGWMKVLRQTQPSPVVPRTVRDGGVLYRADVDIGDGVGVSVFYLIPEGHDPADYQNCPEAGCEVSDAKGRKTKISAGEIRRNADMLVRKTGRERGNLYRLPREETLYVIGPEWMYQVEMTRPSLVDPAGVLDSWDLYRADVDAGDGVRISAVYLIRKGDDPAVFRDHGPAWYEVHV